MPVGDPRLPLLRAGALLWATHHSSEEYGYVMGTGASAGGFLRRAEPCGATRKR